MKQEREIKKPGVVWIFTIISIIGCIIGLLLTSYVYLTEFENTNSYGIAAMTLIAVIYLVAVVLNTIFIYKFFNLQKNALNWMYGAYGVYIGIALLSMQIISLAGMAFWIWVIRDYVTKKKIDDKQLFT